MAFRLLEDQFKERLSKAKAADRRFMELALSLGRRGLGRTAPNPAVGAVLVKDSLIVGRGWTQPGGRPHAEVEAIRRAGDAARGATLYVTLEPCSHHGRSPPCADAVIAAGIARVVSAIEDTNPEVAGQGHARLRAAGITVDVGLCSREAAQDHAGHFLRVCEQRSHVTLKLAVSSDDRIGGAGHTRVQITGDAARAHTHLLRARSDAIMVGIGTALADDPALTCRLPGMEKRSPIRVVLDRSLRLPGDGELIHSARATPLWVIAGETAEAASAARLGAAGAQVIHLRDDNGRFDIVSLLQELSKRDVTRLLVEGGARVASAFIAADLVDDVWLLRGPDAIGAGGVAALGETPLSAITQSARYEVAAQDMLGPDKLTIYRRAQRG